MLNLVRHTNNSRKIIQEGYSFLLVSHPSELQKENVNLLDGFIIDTDSEFFAERIIKEVRTSQHLTNSLKPIFVNGIYQLSKRLMMHTDGFMELTLFQSYLQRIITINKRITRVNQVKTLSNEYRIQHRTLAFLYTRNKVLEPLTSRNSLIGYEFPFISLFYKENEVMSLLDNLRKMKENSLLSFSLIDYIHTCKSCSSNYLNFRECCPKCNSIDIQAHDMIHHFVCAHVAPEKDFKVEDGLECPKCDKGLRHIGIDYDKPSTIYSCNSCSHEFQNPGMQSLCMDCGTESDLSELIQKAIGVYSITEKGETMLFKGGYSNSKNYKSIGEVGSMSIELFKIILHQEIKRIKATKGNSIFAKISFRNNQLEVLNKEAKKNLNIEIGKIITSYLKESDVIGTDRFNEYYLLLPETKEKELSRLDQIQYNLSKLLRDNMNNDTQPIEVMIHSIAGDESMKNLLS